ncbi:hypothetical protein [Spirulina sp. 06S082]|uniref:hypothetical protein n=1 Tax=Spirulina sp. 06S082 TaxID=3110248 RepID=UPI002B215E36|nr:hypothetical protein [Spirulina sp. 06S082]MEA5470270.1 hypothetical protein [Spirulina sp. 06S082]
MNIKAFLLASILGLSVPAIASTAIAPSAIAQVSAPVGTFVNNTWFVRISYINNAYFYEGNNKNTGDSITLSGATFGGNSNRRTMTWNNGGYRYQVAWQPNDPGTIRVQVFSPNGQRILNQLLSQAG